MTFKERLQSLKGKQIIIKKSVLFPVLLLIVLIIIGFALTKSDDDSAETGNRDQDVVVEQSPDQSPPSRDIVDNGSVAGNNTGNGSGQSSNETDPGKVLGTQNPPTTTTPPRSGETVAKPAAPVVSPKPVAPTTQKVRYAPLGFELSVPNAWKHRAEQSGGSNIIVFYEADSVHGTIQVLGTAYTSLAQLETELRANSMISGISQSEFNGMPALMYYNSSTQGMHTAVLVNGRVYIFNGMSLSKYLGRIMFF